MFKNPPPPTTPPTPRSLTLRTPPPPPPPPTPDWEDKKNRTHTLKKMSRGWGRGQQEIWFITFQEHTVCQTLYNSMSVSFSNKTISPWLKWLLPTLQTHFGWRLLLWLRWQVLILFTSNVSPVSFETSGNMLRSWMRSWMCFHLRFQGEVLKWIHGVAEHV